MFISPRKILKKPEIMDHIADPYVVVTHTEWGLPNNEEVLDAVNILYWRGWETINISFAQMKMAALVKNPRAKQKKVDES